MINKLRHSFSYIFKHTLLLLVTMLFIFVSMSYFVKTEAIYHVPNDYQEMNFDGTYDWEKVPNEKTSSTDYIPYSVIHNDYVLTEEVQALLDDTNGKFVRFDTAQELYQFSIDVSFIKQATLNESTLEYQINQSLITALLSLDYVLGQDIDYSTMKSKAFIPIGYRFVGFNSQLYDNVFTGSFDGQGFEIKNLYLAGYDEFVIGTNPALTEVLDEPTASYYAMFTINEGTVKNLGLRNPNLEILQVNEKLKYLSNLVGQNDGIVDHVYVTDTRESVTDAGIRYRVGDTGKIFSAAGIIHTNNHMFTNAYYVSKVVVNGNYINKFYVEPLVYENNGFIDYLVYGESVYLDIVSVGTSTFEIETPQNGVGEFDYELMFSQYSSLNHTNSLWYFYENDGYPILQGLIYDINTDAYLIEDAVDLAFFPKLLNYQTVFYNTPFTQANYHVVNDIDMGVLAEGIYQVPNQTFNGTFYASNPFAIDNSDHYYIHHLKIDQYLLANSKIYAGLFSILGNGALVKDLNITYSSINILSGNDSYSYDNYIGGLAGQMIAASIEDVYIDMDINMVDSLTGSLSVGGLVGIASGTINRVSTHGDIHIGQQTYSGEDTPIEGLYYIGGAVGSTTSAKLTAKELVNHGSITSLGTSGPIYLSDGHPFTVETGGVIGHIHYDSLYKHEISQITNRGSIYLQSVQMPSNGLGVQYTGGIFGRLSGSVPDVEKNKKVQFGYFYNGEGGDIYYTNNSDDVDIYASGIAVIDLDDSYELGLFTNYGTFNFDINGSSLLNNHFHYASIIYDIGHDDFTLSRVYNYGDYNYNNSAYLSTYGLVESLNDNHILLRYSANYGDTNFLTNDSNNPLIFSNDVTISGITTEPNVEYKNVHNAGNISVINLDMQNYDLYISGFTKVLQNPYSIINSLNRGNIVFANIKGSGNIYVAGFVNINHSGDLHQYGLDVEQPTAEIGIINSVNAGDISTTYSSSVYGIDGTNNTFVGGLVSLNERTIQDSSNLGNIALYNSNTNGVSIFVNDQYRADLIESYSGGIVAGGVSAMIISGDSRIYDSANSGDVLVKTSRFSRAGGVLGVSLYEESIAGSIDTNLLTNNIENSVLSNGLNFGDISAITSQIDTYSTEAKESVLTLVVGDNPDINQSYYRRIDYTFDNTEGSAERLPVYASAGGVIGYGLSYMQRMLNHGLISSTDVAGGIVGATYVLGGGASYYPETVVNISTAVNYGDIKSIDFNDYPNINVIDFSTDTLSDYYMSDGNDFIFPPGYTREGPRSKRGFGGIFGRLQRGTNGTMTSRGGAFDFIVNANENIDLIGRIDQVEDFSNSVTAYVFNDAIYYSAKKNDTTQTVFSGFNYSPYGTVTDIEYTGYTRERVGFWIWSYWLYTFYYDITVTNDTFYTQQGLERNPVNLPSSSAVFQETRERTSSTPPGSDYDIGDTINEYIYYGTADIPWITEDPLDPDITDPSSQYMYDDAFPMRTLSELTEYIYFSEETLLADRFQSEGTNPRPNGMYVLSTSAGETYGSVLPNNIRLDNIRLIDENENVNFDLDYKLLLENDQLDIDPELIDKYNDLRQTIYNDKSNLVEDEDNQSFIIQETTESENQLLATDIPNFLNSGIDLGIDYDQKVVTFAISMEAFISSQTTASFEIVNALTSSNALIGIRQSESPLSITDLQDLLNQEAYMKIASNPGARAQLNVNLPNYDIQSPQLLTVGYFGVYSEAFYMDPENGIYDFSNSDYFNEYRIDIYFMPNFSESSYFTGVESVNFNQLNTINVLDTDPLDLRPYEEVNPDGSLTLNFKDNNQLLLPGYDFSSYFDLYFHTGELVLEEYYEVDSIAVDSLGNYSITFTFLNNISGGNYYLEYSYYPNSRKYRIDFTKRLSSQNNIIDFTYTGDNDSVPTNITNSFSSTMGLGQELTIDETIDNYSIYENASNDYLYDLYQISYMTPGSLRLSPFAKVISARRLSSSLDEVTGYRTIVLEYMIEAEDGTTSTYLHTITERQIFIERIKRNGNEVALDNAYALREDQVTYFSVDLGFEQALSKNLAGKTTYPYGDPLTNIEVLITGIDFQGNPISNVQGITYSFGELMTINMSILTEPGVYNFKISYRRTDSIYVQIATELFGDLSIIKKEGTNAYLKDIRFSEFANETVYPNIEITNDDHEILTTPYDPKVYFNGFDYDGADEAEIQYFRIEGKVSNVPLNDYQPLFLDYLPIGSTIAREYWNGSSWVYTGEVAKDATEAEKAVLSADFTTYPETATPIPSGPVIIRYRITSEDQENIVYYDLIVTDVVYNVTFIFDLYYCADGSQSTCVLANQSQAFNNQLVIINMQNLVTNGPYNIQDTDDPDDYPYFSSVIGLENRTTQLYYTTDEEYIYRFGRNRSFYYNIYLDLPLDEYLNDLYTYDIEFELGGEVYQLNDASNYVSDLQGKYFYIEDSIYLRTRKFNIYIYPVETSENNQLFGLYDFFKSWGDKE
ncbi:hypothetical protein KHQ88_05755 [Mycoplasmatota bacterium]|nr:hypothetical protein KHQ88_05755 [Mycoplasmatota bacterium]